MALSCEPSRVETFHMDTCSCPAVWGGVGGSSLGERKKNRSLTRKRRIIDIQTSLACQASIAGLTVSAARLIKRMLPRDHCQQLCTALPCGNLSASFDNLRRECNPHRESIPAEGDGSERQDLIYPK